jgi:hypothetical protein
LRLAQKAGEGVSRASLRYPVDDCFACGLTRPCEQHHVIPRASGGEDGPTVPLCLSCHAFVTPTRMHPYSRDPSEWLEGLAGLWRKAGTSERLVLLSIIGTWRGTPGLGGLLEHPYE